MKNHFFFLTPMPPKPQPTAANDAPSVPVARVEDFCGSIFIIDDTPPGIPVAPARQFPADMFTLDLDDLDEADDFHSPPVTARPPMVAPLAGVAGNRPVFLAPLMESHSEQPSARHFPDQPAGYVFDAEVTDYTRQLWQSLPRNFFWLIMGSAPSADIFFD